MCALKVEGTEERQPGGVGEGWETNEEIENTIPAGGLQLVALHSRD